MKQQETHTSQFHPKALTYLAIYVEQRVYTREVKCRNKVAFNTAWGEKAAALGEGKRSEHT